MKYKLAIAVGMIALLSACGAVIRLSGSFPPPTVTLEIQTAPSTRPK
jgi:hypothetical protein